AVVVDGVELGGQGGVRPGLAAADAAVAVAVHRVEVDLVVADDRIGRAGSDGDQRLARAGGRDGRRRGRGRRGGDRFLRGLRRKRGLDGRGRGLRTGRSGRVGRLAGLDRGLGALARAAGGRRTRSAGLVGGAVGLARGFLRLDRGFVGDVGLVFDVRGAVAGQRARAPAGGGLLGR